MSPEVLTFEQFAAREGAGRQDVGDAGLHRSSEHVSGAARRAVLAKQGESDSDWMQRRAALRERYADALHSGAIRQPTLRERLEAKAAGDPNRGDVQAARRLLAKLQHQDRAA